MFLQNKFLQPNFIKLTLNLKRYHWQDRKSTLVTREKQNCYYFTLLYKTHGIHILTDNNLWFIVLVHVIEVNVTVFDTCTLTRLQYEMKHVEIDNWNLSRDCVLELQIYEEYSKMKTNHYFRHATCISLYLWIK